MNHSQTIQKVLSKLTRSNEVRQTSIRRGDDSNVDRRHPPVRAHRLDLAVLEKTQNAACIRRLIS